MIGIEDISFKYLKQNKARTILNIISIVVATALISFIGNSLLGVIDIFNYKNTRSFGTQTVKYEKISNNIYNKLKNNVYIDDIVLEKNNGKLLNYEINGTKGFFETKNYLPYFFSSYTKGMEKIVPNLLNEGRYPENENELVVDLSILDKTLPKPKLGEKIKVSYLSGEKEEENTRDFTIVGLTESKEENYNTAMAGLQSFLSKPVEESNYTGYVFMNKSQATYKFYEILEKFGITDAATSNYNPALEDPGLVVVISVVGMILFSLILITSFGGIYTVFNVSFNHRLKEYCLLRALGATNKQIKAVKKKELYILSAIAIPLGLAFGYFMLYFTFIKPTNTIFSQFGFYDFRFKIYPEIFVLAASISILIVYYLLNFTSNRKKLSPVDAFDHLDYLGNRVSKKKYRMLKKIFGIESYLAKRDIDRSRKNYLYSTFTVAITITIFVSITFFTLTLTKLQRVNYENISDIEIYLEKGENTSTAINPTELVRKLNSLPDVDDVKSYKNFLVSVDIPIGDIKDYRGYKQYENNNDLATFYGSQVIIMDRETIKKVYKLDDKTVEEMIKNNEVIIYETNAGMVVDDNLTSTSVGINLKTGYYTRFKVAKNKIKDQYAKLSYAVGLNVIIPEEVLQNKNLQAILDGTKSTINVDMIKSSKNDSVIKLLFEENITNYVDSTKLKTTRLGQFKIVKMYAVAFALLITLISSINIINTMSAIILERVKDLSIYKALGMTKKGFNKMLFYESYHYSITGAFIGLVFSTFISLVISKIVFGDLNGISKIINYTAASFFAITILVVIEIFVSLKYSLKKSMKEGIVSNLRRE